MYKCFVDYVGKDTLHALSAHTHFNYFPVASVKHTDKMYTARRQIFQFLKNVCALDICSSNNNICDADNVGSVSNHHHNNNNTDINIVEDCHKFDKCNEPSENTVDVNNSSEKRLRSEFSKNIVVMSKNNEKNKSK